MHNAAEELLNKKSIIQHLTSENKSLAENLVILDEIDSTNTYLSQNQETNICFAESQTAGKGRLGRSWFSPYASNIYLSLRWDFEQNASKLEGLSLAIGVAIVETLKNYGIKQNILVKWPNDIFWQNRKLAGILIECSPKKPKGCHAIIGVGLNVKIPTELVQNKIQPWCDVAQITNSLPQRNKLAGLLLDKLLTTLTIYQEQGLKPFLKEWYKLDATLGKKVTIIMPQQQEITGVGCGVNDHGHFLLKDCNNKIHTFAIGEVSLRPC